MPTTLTITGVPTSSIEDLLAATLSPQQRGELFVRPSKDADPFSPPERGEGATFQTVVEFTAAAIAGGVIYDLVKTAALGTFGRSKVLADAGEAHEDVDPAD